MSDRKLKLVSEDGDILICRLADSFWKRFTGLMGKPRPSNGEGLLIRPCNSIHMFFMKFSIDAVFLDRNFNVVKLIRNLEPNRIIGTIPGAWQVLEVPAGNLPTTIVEGTRFTVSEL